MLYGQQLDPFGLHNWFGFELGRLTGEYAIRTKHCEVRLTVVALPSATPIMSDISVDLLHVH